MPPWAWGFLAGCFCALLLAAAAGVVAYRRLVVLERRAIQAERLAELGTLTGGLAHEIKNPLSTIQLNLQLLREDLIPDNPAYERIVHRLDRVQGETSRLREILDDFLRYAGRMELERKPVDLRSLLEELVDFYAPQAQAQRVQLRLKRPGQPVTIQGDAKLIKPAVINLMINATQAL